LSLSPERREEGKSGKIAGLAFLTFTGILLALATIIFAEANPAIRADVLSGLFVTCVWLFAIVVVVYAGIIMDTGPRNGSTQSQSASDSQGTEPASLQSESLDDTLRKSIKQYLEDRIGISQSLDPATTEAATKYHLGADPYFASMVLSYTTLRSQERTDRRSWMTQIWLVAVTALLVYATLRG
jgi:hypothetical protein